MADKMVQPEKHARPVSGEARAALNTGGASQGREYPNDAADGDADFHGGQTEQAYYGGDQLGDEVLGRRNPNAPSTSEDEEDGDAQS